MSLFMSWERHENVNCESRRDNNDDSCKNMSMFRRNSWRQRFDRTHKLFTNEYWNRYIINYDILRIFGYLNNST